MSARYHKQLYNGLQRGDTGLNDGVVGVYLGDVEPIDGR
jgi:hypothetical protein